MTVCTTLTVKEAVAAILATDIVITPSTIFPTEAFSLSVTLSNTSSVGGRAVVDVTRDGVKAFGFNKWVPANSTVTVTYDNLIFDATFVTNAIPGNYNICADVVSILPI